MKSSELQKAMNRLAMKIGPEVLAINIAVDPNTNFIALTTKDGVLISQKVYDKDPDNIEVYIAHEILHHIVGDHEANYKHPHHLINIADDYKINQLLEEMFGYDVKKVKFPGLRNKKFDKMTVAEIADYLAKKKNVQNHPHPAWAACREVIIAADAVKRRYGMQDRYPFKIEDEQFQEVRNAAIPFFMPALAAVDIERARDAIALHLFLEKPKHNLPEGTATLTRWEALAYLIKPYKYRQYTIGSAIRSQMVAKRILTEISKDDDYIRRLVYQVNNRIRAIQQEIVLRIARPTDYDQSKEHRFSKLNMQELQDRMVRHKARASKLLKMRPIGELLASEVVQVRNTNDKSSVTVSQMSLNSKPLPKTDKARVPKVVETELTRRIRAASVRIANDVEKFEEAKKVARRNGINLGPLEDIQPPPSPKIDLEDLLRDIAGGGDGEGDIIGGEEGDSEDDMGGLSSSPIVGGGGAGEGPRVRESVSANELLLENANILLRVIQNMTEIDAMMSKNSAKKTQDSGSLPVMISYGNDVENVFPSEFALLANKMTELSFFVKFAESALLQQMPENKKQGAVVLAIDTSGSMMGERLEMALGFGMAMANRLTKEGRGFSMVFFSDAAYKTVDFDEKMTVIDLLKIFSELEVGGTEFQPALTECFNVRDRRKWKETNSILVTDGYASFTDPAKLLARKTVKDKVDTVLIGGYSMDTQKGLIDNVYKTEKCGLLIALLSIAGKVL